MQDGMSDSSSREIRKKAGIIIFAGVTLLVVLGAGTALWRFRHPGKQTPLLTSPRDDLGMLVSVPRLLWVTADHLNMTAARRFDDGRVVKYRVTTGGMGIRGGNPSPKGHRLRILAVGDSTTFGLGVNDEETWCVALQQLLDPEHEVIDVINAGVVGYSLFQTRRRIEQLAPVLEPDLVLMTVGHNDESSNLGYGDADTAARLAEPARYEGYARLHNLLYPERAIDPEEKRPRMRRGEFLDDLERCCRVMRDRGLALVLIDWPYTPEVFPELGSLRSYYGLVRDAARETDTLLIDLVPAFRRAGPGGFIDMVHATADGNRIIAQAIAENLREAFKNGLCESWQRQSVARARKLLDEGRASDAEHLLQLHLNIAPRAYPYELLGRARVAREDRLGALVAWTAGMEADAGHYQNFDLAYQLLREEGPAANREFWLRMTERLPDSNLVWANLGRACMELRFHEEAATVLRKSLELGPGNAAVLAQLGEALELLGKSREAIEAYEKALAINPEIPNIAGRARVLRERNEAAAVPGG